jgi:hypothetical protein
MTDEVTSVRGVDNDVIESRVFSTTIDVEVEDGRPVLTHRREREGGEEGQEERGEEEEEGQGRSSPKAQKSLSSLFHHSPGGGGGKEGGGGGEGGEGRRSTTAVPLVWTSQRRSTCSWQWNQNEKDHSLGRESCHRRHRQERSHLTAAK